ncbi:MAG: hypothetical protein ACK559_06055, partial [bacterium]
LNISECSLLLGSQGIHDCDETIAHLFCLNIFVHVASEFLAHQFEDVFGRSFTVTVEAEVDSATVQFPHLFVRVVCVSVGVK